MTPDVRSPRGTRTLAADEEIAALAVALLAASVAYEADDGRVSSPPSRWRSAGRVYDV